jgi:hypothetical protein
MRESERLLFTDSLLYGQAESSSLQEGIAVTTSDRREEDRAGGVSILKYCRDFPIELLIESTTCP